MSIIQSDDILKVYEQTVEETREHGLAIDEENSSCSKPWGAYIRISNGSLQKFYDLYWNGVETPAACGNNPVAPKILLVAPGKRLSLQYHNRRSEKWRIIEGPVKIVRGVGLDDLKVSTLETGDVVEFKLGEWHRLESAGGWGKVAEIWCHTDVDNLSDEDDIVRIEDDFGR